MPYSTTLLAGKIDVEDAGIRIMGILWLAAALLFVAAGVGVITMQPWWFSLTLYTSLFSLAMCILSWPDARFGVFVNLAILAFLIIGARMGFLPPLSQ